MNTFTGAKCPQLQAIYADAESTMESRTKTIYMLMLRLSVPIIVIQFIFWSFFQYFRTDFSNDSFVLIYPWLYVYQILRFFMSVFISLFQILHSNPFLFSLFGRRLPFNWKSPIGYIIVTFFQIIGIVSCSEVCVVVLCYYTGVCLAITTFISDIEYNLKNLNVETTADSKTSSEQTRIIQMFNEIIQFHSETTE